jgi:hypothetical protein
MDLIIQLSVVPAGGSNPQALFPDSNICLIQALIYLLETPIHMLNQACGGIDAKPSDFSEDVMRRCRQRSLAHASRDITQVNSNF